MDIISHLIKKERPIDTGVARGVAGDNKSSDETSAGEEVIAKMAEQKELFEEGVRKIKTAMEEALAKRNRKWHVWLEIEKKLTLLGLIKEESEREMLHVDWETLKKEKGGELARERKDATAQLLESKK